MFYDEAKIYVKGGDGGNGIVAFRREKYIPLGGPSGGDGGRGGDVILQADTGLRTLVDFSYRAHHRADRGSHGQGKNRHGRDASDLIINVPVGVVVRDAADDRVIADLLTPGQQVVVAAGGRGGRGNARFATKNNKAPRFAEKGEPGEERWLLLELKLLADVGLIGMPNAGKSTLLARISAARPKIADYPFTTLTPNLGVVGVGREDSFVAADIPGLIAGAHQGAGLGLKFLRHIERTRMLVHVIDMSLPKEEIMANWRIVMEELKCYNPDLALKPQVIAANKIDVNDEKSKVNMLEKELAGAYPVFSISAVTGEGIDALLYHLTAKLAELPLSLPLIEPEEEKVTAFAPDRLIIKREGDIFVVENSEAERRVAMTYLDNEESLRRLQAFLEHKGIEAALCQAGVYDGAVVRIGKYEFEYRE